RTSASCTAHGNSGTAPSTAANPEYWFKTSPETSCTATRTRGRGLNAAVNAHASTRDNAGAWVLAGTTNTGTVSTKEPPHINAKFLELPGSELVTPPGRISKWLVTTCETRLGSGPHGGR